MWQLKRATRAKPAARARLLGGALIFMSVGVTAWLGIRSTGDTLPTASESAILVIFAALLQIAGGASFASVGRADPTLARSSVRHLLSLAQRAQRARSEAETAFETKYSDHHAVLGRLSVSLSYIQEDAELAAKDWYEFHQDALSDLIQESADGTEGG